MGKGFRRRPGKDIKVEDWSKIFSTAYCFNCKKVTQVSVVTDGKSMSATCTLCNTTLSKQYIPIQTERTNSNPTPPKPSVFGLEPDDSTLSSPKGINENHNIR